MRHLIFTFILVFQLVTTQGQALEGLPLYYWQKAGKENFGDHLSMKLVERIVGGKVTLAKKGKQQAKKLLAIGSILIWANSNDVVWGTGMNAKRLDMLLYKFDNLDVRAVRGPMTRDFLKEKFNISCPEIYGDPALLTPYFFPELKRKKHPSYSYVIIPHYSEEHLFPKDLYPNVVYPTEPWKDVISKILDSEFVISSSLHGLVIADAYGIPARYLRVTEHEPLFKYYDYYLGTNRPSFTIATSVEEALKMGGELPCEFDCEKLYQSFPFEYWPTATFRKSLNSDLDPLQ